MAALLAVLLCLGAAACRVGPGVTPDLIAPPSGSTPASPDATSPAEPSPSEPARGASVSEVTGVLIVGDGEPVPGVLGSYTLDEGGSDSPWLPWTERGLVAVRGGAPIAIGLADGSPIGAWAADLATADDLTGSSARPIGGREAEAPALDSVPLEPLQPGRWVLAVELVRADGRGHGLTFWSLLVAG